MAIQGGAGTQGYGNYGMGGFRQRMPSFRPRFPIDKSKSTCKAYKGIGYWAGDPPCPMNGFGAGAGASAGNLTALLGQKPAAPGTG